MYVVPPFKGICPFSTESGHHSLCNIYHCTLTLFSFKVWVIGCFRHLWLFCRESAMPIQVTDRCCMKKIFVWVKIFLSIIWFSKIEILKLIILYYGFQEEVARQDASVPCLPRDRLFRLPQQTSPREAAVIWCTTTGLRQPLYPVWSTTVPQCPRCLLEKGSPWTSAGVVSRIT